MALELCGEPDIGLLGVPFSGQPFDIFAVIEGDYTTHKHEESCQRTPSQQDCRVGSRL